MTGGVAGPAVAVLGARAVTLVSSRFVAGRTGALLAMPFSLPGTPTAVTELAPALLLLGDSMGCLFYLDLRGQRVRRAPCADPFPSKGRGKQSAIRTVVGPTR